MDRTRHYETPGALRQALEDRLRERSLSSGEDLGRLRRLVAFDRVLARLFADRRDAPWILKGGFSLEIRYRMGARATKDLDLSIPDVGALGDLSGGVVATVLDRLRAAVERDPGDGFRVAIGARRIGLVGPPGGGARFPVEVHLAGRPFATFHLDVGIGDGIIGEPEWMAGEEFLAFAGIPPARVALLPVAQQIAEKLHAYTKPREGRANTRVKDLVDLMLVLEREAPGPPAVKAAVEATFSRPGSHRIPAVLPEPPVGWDSTYRELAQETAVSTPTCAEAHARLSEFWNTLGHGAHG